MGKCDITYLDKHLMKILNILNLKKLYCTFYSYSISLMCEWWVVIFYLIFQQLSQQSKHNFQWALVPSVKSQWKAGERKKFVPKGEGSRGQLSSYLSLTPPPTIHYNSKSNRAGWINACKFVTSTCPNTFSLIQISLQNLFLRLSKQVGLIYLMVSIVTQIYKIKTIKTHPLKNLCN